MRSHSEMSKGERIAALTFSKIMAIFKVYKSSLMLYTLYYIDCFYIKSSFSKEIAMLSDFLATAVSRIVAKYNKPRKNFCPWRCRFRTSAMTIPRNSIALFWPISAQKHHKGSLNSELLPLESPWQFHEQKFRIDISLNRGLGP